MKDPAPTVVRLGHIATRRQLARFGFTGYDLTAAVNRCGLRRVRNGLYATPRATEAQYVAVRVGGKLAGPTAAASYGLYAGFDSRIHVCVPSNAARLRLKVPPSATFAGESREADRSSRPVEVHWLPGKHDPQSDEVWRVSLAESLVQTALWCDRETAVAAADMALEKRLVSREALAAAFAAAPERVRFVPEVARRGSHSGLESVVRQRLTDLGLRYRQQVRIDGLGRIDGLVEECVGVELDGDRWRSGDEYGARDKERDAVAVAVAVAAGIPILRVRFARVFSAWPEVEAQILQALVQFGNVETQERAALLRIKKAISS